MRIRGVLTAAAAALVLAGCGGQSGPAGGESSPADPRIKGLRVEVEAQMQDPCFRRPAELAPADCQKYITQLTSTPDSAKMITGTQPAIDEAARELSEGIAAYRGNSCAGVTGENSNCTQALVAIADALRQMHNALETGAG